MKKTFFLVFICLAAMAQGQSSGIIRGSEITNLLQGDVRDLATGREISRDEVRNDHSYIITCPERRRNPGPCWIPDSLKEFAIRQITSMSSCPAKIADSARLARSMRARSFFRECEIRGSLNEPQGVPGTVAKELRRAFLDMRHGHSRLDSIKLVVNFVHHWYSYEEPNRQAPEDIDSTFALLRSGHLWGLCSNSAHFFAGIERQLFPWWGYALELNSSTDSLGGPCAVSHVFVGISDSTGKITMIVDPTINGIWVNERGKPLCLDSIQKMIWRGSHPIAARTEYFGKYHAEPLVNLLLDPSSICEWDAMFSPQDDFEFEGQYSSGTRDTVIARGPLKEFDYRDPVIGWPEQDWYWNQYGIPSGACGWWCTTIFIRGGSSPGTPSSVKALITRNYGFPVY